LGLKKLSLSQYLPEFFFNHRLFSFLLKHRAIINDVNASSPADSLTTPVDTPSGALRITGEFGVLGNEEIVFQTYYN
jgi:hypothetical protein